MKLIPSKIRQKQLFVFDLDGTLAESKLPADKEMISLLSKLIKARKVAVIGGGKYGLFQDQLLSQMRGWSPKLLENLFLFPTNATRMYRYSRGWKQIYEHRLSAKEIKKIRAAFERMFKDVRYVHPKKTYGAVIENRATQITFSALGQNIAQVGRLHEKVAWNRKYGSTLRMRMARRLQQLLPEFKVRVGGLTSIDVTRKGIDKAYGIREIERHLRIPKSKMLFVGDAIFPGGNDYAVVKAGVEYVKVKSAEDTKRLLTKILAALY